MRYLLWDACELCPTYWLSFAVIAVALYLTVILYLKLRYPFWSRQPVYHVYDLWATRGASRVVHENGLPITKYYRPERFQTRALGDLEESDLEDVADFMRCHGSAADNVLVTMTPNILKHLLGNTPKGAGITVTKSPYGIQGCVYAVIYTMVFNGTTRLNIQYIPWVGLHRDYAARKNGYFLLETHWVNQDRRHDHAFPLTVIKKEGEQEGFRGVVPLVQYTAWVVEGAALPVARTTPNHSRCVVLDNRTLDAFLKEVGTRFRLNLWPEVHGLIAVGEMFVYGLRQTHPEAAKTTILMAYYCFRDAHVLFEGATQPGDTLTLVGSFGTCSSDDFFRGFLEAWDGIQKIKKYTTLVMEETSHNERLVAHLKAAHGKSIWMSFPCAYYSHNWVCPGTPLRGAECLLL